MFFSVFDGNPPTAYKLQFCLSKRFVHYDCSLPEIETSRALNMSQHVHARLSHFVTNRLFCMQRLDSTMKGHFQSCEEMRKKKQKKRWGSICHFSPVTCASDVYADWWRTALTLLLTSTKTKQFAWNDWWVLICWEQQTQQMSVLRSKLFFFFFQNLIHSKTEQIKWDINAFVRSGDRRQETAEWLLLRWLLASAHVPDESAMARWASSL